MNHALEKASIQKLKKKCDVQINSNHNQSDISEQQLRSQLAKIARSSIKRKRALKLSNNIYLAKMFKTGLNCILSRKTVTKVLSNNDLHI